MKGEGEMDYGKALRVARTAKGYSQRQLADAAHIDASHVSLIETGHRKPSLDVLQRLAEALGVPLDIITLLAAGPSRLKGISPARAEDLGRWLLDLLWHEQEVS